MHNKVHLWLALALLVAYLIPISALGQETRVVTRSDISGSATTVAIASSGRAKWVQIMAPSANSSDVRWGDSNTTIAVGGIIEAGGGQFLPPLPPDSRRNTREYVYLLSTIYVYVASGDKVVITWAAE